LQLRELDHPVIDQSGLTDRFDFTLNWTPDEFQFPRASAAQRAAVPTDPDAPPDLFTAFQEQLGMKLEAKKAPTNIVVIDKCRSRRRAKQRYRRLACPGDKVQS
jgi:bla regulator protein blaR1